MMRFLSDLRERLAFLRASSAERAALQEEMESHLQMEIDANVRRGMTREDAIRAAHHKFGSVDRFVEETHDASGVAVILDFAHDLRFALRGMRRLPGFTAVAVGTIALGIGAATAVFSVADAMLYKPIAGVRDPSALALLHIEQNIDRWGGLSYPNFEDLANNAPAFSSIMGYTTSAELQIHSRRVGAIQITGEAVIGDYFGTLGLSPKAGRFFTREEIIGAQDPHVAVVSDRLASILASDDRVIGSELTINGRKYSVIGVTPRGFRGPARMLDHDMWLPGSAYGELRHNPRIQFGERGGGSFFEFIGRLQPGATIAQAQAQLDAAYTNLKALFPAEAERLDGFKPQLYAGIGITPRMRATTAKTGRLLIIIGILVYIVAAANSANLLIFRALRTRGESAVRRALGASAGRLLQHHIAQGLVIGLAGAALGILFVIVLIRGIGDVWLFGLTTLSDIPLDSRVMIFAVGLAVASTTAFAVIPTFLAQRLSLVENLRESARQGSGRMQNVRRTLVVAQLAVSASLIVPALLLGRTIRNLRSVDVGFDAEHVMMLSVTPEPQGYTPEQVAQFRDRVLSELKQQPDAGDVTIAASSPFSHMSFGTALRGPMQGAKESIDVTVQWIAPDYFSTMRIPLEGREFRRDEYNTPLPSLANGIILSRSAAMKTFGRTDVVGRTVIVPGYREDHNHIVIGVANDARMLTLRQEDMPAIYRPIAEAWTDDFYVLMRFRGSEAAAENAVRSTLAGIDANIPVARVQVLSSGVRDAMSQERLFAWLGGMLGAMSIALSAIGLYGILAYAVAQRKREIGVRMALGAGRGSIVALVTQEGLVMAAVGGALGCVGGFWLARMMNWLYFDATPLSGGVYLATYGLLVGVAVIAAAAPARNAAAVHPATALNEG
jgi:predicted permease